MAQIRSQLRNWYKTMNNGNFFPHTGNTAVDDFLDWMTSPSALLSCEVMEQVWTRLEVVDVDAECQLIIWPDGEYLTIPESVARIHREYDELPVPLIETHLLCWLQLSYRPDGYSEEQMEDFNELLDEWVAVYKVNETADTLN